MKKQPFITSFEWVTYFYENAQVSEARYKPVVEDRMTLRQREIISRSLPAWQLGETSEGNHLRAAARQYAEAQGDPAFLSAVELFIREEQRHGVSLGEWLDLVGISRRSHDLGDSLFRLCRYAIPNYAAWASVVVMVEAMAEIYYSAVKRVTDCPRLDAECARILADEVKHIQFQCEHLAATRRHLPSWVRGALRIAEAAFYGVVCTAVWIAHGELLREADIPLSHFIRLAAKRFRIMQKLMNPERYDFGLIAQYEKWRGRLSVAES